MASENEIQDDDTEYSYYDQNFDISPLQEVDNVKVFAFTTTGSPGTFIETDDTDKSFAAVPIIQAVVAETERSDEIFDETTTGTPILATNIEKVETGQIKPVSLIDESSTEYTTVRVVADSNIVEASSKKIISASDNNGIIESTETIDGETSTTKEPDMLSKQPVNVNSDIVQVEAGKVNGPLSLDEVIYYDDADGNEEDLENDIPENENVENKNNLENDGALEDSRTRNASGLTTVVNGFIINKNQVVKTLDNNNIETVRTGGDTEPINIEISKDNSTTENITYSTLASLKTATDKDIEDLTSVTFETTTERV